MKKHILFSSVIIAGAMVTGCSENAWNDHLDGFEGGYTYNEKITTTYTLTATDYETIGKALAAVATTDAEKAAASAIQSNHYFDKSSVYPAAVAIPYLLNPTSSDYFIYSNGSVAEITFLEASATPEEIGQIASAQTYTLSNSDYQTVWDSETAFISSFAPENPASSNLPSILKSHFPDAEEGQYAVVSYNVANENPMFGYPDAPIPTGALVTGDLTSGSYYLAGPEKGVVAVNLTSNYGYLPSFEVTFSSEEVSGVDPSTQLFIFESTGTAGEFFIQDPATEKYYYQSGTYNSFNVSAGKDASGTTIDNYTWIVTAKNDNTWQIMNKGVSKWIQTPFGSYSTWGSYNYKGDDNDNFPTLYAPADDDDAEVAEIPLYTPVYQGKNTVYYYNGSAWSEAEGVISVNPSDYTEMGFSNNSLTDPELYIPLYLKTALPYAMAGDEIYVAYNIKTNSCSCDLFVFDGSSWTMNNNALEEVTGAFTKNNGTWTFTKYLGKAIFDLFEEQEIQRDRTYLIVSGAVCATPVSATNSYGYLLTTPVSIASNQIVMQNEVNGFTFASTYEVNGQTYTVPEGKFLIRDSNERYLYLQGSYSSFNLRAESPALEADGSVVAGYLFSATMNADGTWTITNDRGEGNIRNIYYSPSYSNFAAYASQGASDLLPTLYILAEE